MKIATFSIVLSLFGVAFATPAAGDDQDFRMKELNRVKAELDDLWRVLGIDSKTDKRDEKNNIFDLGKAKPIRIANIFNDKPVDVKKGIPTSEISRLMKGATKSKGGNGKVGKGKRNEGSEAKDVGKAKAIRIAKVIDGKPVNVDKGIPTSEISHHVKGATKGKRNEGSEIKDVGKAKAVRIAKVINGKPVNVEKGIPASAISHHVQGATKGKVETST